MASMKIKGSITLPSSITSIGSLAFSGYINLKSIKLPSSITSIGDGAFRMAKIEIA